MLRELIDTLRTTSLEYALAFLMYFRHIAKSHPDFLPSQTAMPGTNPHHSIDWDEYEKQFRHYIGLIESCAAPGKEKDLVEIFLKYFDTVRLKAETLSAQRAERLSLSHYEEVIRAVKTADMPFSFSQYCRAHLC